MAKILLIDDMKMVRSAISAVLRSEGHDVIEAEDGNEGLKLAGSSSFDLVITDIMMPTTDGTDVVFALADKKNAPPIIAISGGGAGIEADGALALASQKADAALIKPFENSVLLETVNSLI